MITLTRSPDGRRASTIGLDSSTRRLTVETMRSMVCISWSWEAKRSGQLLDPAAAFDEDRVRAVDHDLRDRGVLEERFEDAEAEGLVDDPADQLGALDGREDRALAADDVARAPAPGGRGARRRPASSSPRGRSPPGAWRGTRRPDGRPRSRWPFSSGALMRARRLMGGAPRMAMGGALSGRGHGGGLARGPSPKQAEQDDRDGDRDRRR